MLEQYERVKEDELTNCPYYKIINRQSPPYCEKVQAYCQVVKKSIGCPFNIKE